MPEVSAVQKYISGPPYPFLLFFDVIFVPNCVKSLTRRKRSTRYSQLLANPLNTLPRGVPGGRKVLLRRENHLFTDDRHGRRRGHTDSHAIVANFEDLDFDVGSDEKTLAGAPTHYKHRVASSRATRGCRREYW